MTTAFVLDFAPTVITKDALSKRRPSNPNQDGAVVHKLTLECDVFEPNLMERVLSLFPGSDVLAKSIASVECKGVELRAKKKLGCIKVSVTNGEQQKLVEDLVARGGIPRLVIGDRALTTKLLLPVELAVSREQETVLRDYFQADVFASVAFSQLDLTETEPKVGLQDDGTVVTLADVEKAKAKAKGKPKKKVTKRAKKAAPDVSEADDDAAFGDGLLAS